jgi:hypothetical protein
MFVVLLTSKALVTKIIFKVKIKFSFQRVIIIIIANKQLNRIATTRVARTKIVI